MTPLLRLARDERGTSAAEFALVLPLMLLFLIGTMDVGLYAWAINRAEKATQAGARVAVVTDPIAAGLASYSFVNKTVGGTTLTQGDPVPASAIGTITCTTSSCTCTGCPGDMTITKASTTPDPFTSVLNRMRNLDPAISAANVVVEYHGSGLGYAGDPSGMDIAPLVTVRLQNQQFQPVSLLLFGASVRLPSFSYTLTMEDGQGSNSN